MASNTPALVKLEDLNPTASIYLGESRGGALLLLETTVDIKGSPQPVHANAKLALALTERSRKMSGGTFYYFIPPALSNSIDLKRRLNHHLAMLPDLFFKPEPLIEIGKGNQRDWDKKSHKKRYLNLDADILRGDIQGLPIYVCYNSGKDANPIFNVDTVCSVTMFFNPKPHVGFTVEMAGTNARFDQLAAGKWDSFVECVVGEGMDKFEQQGIDALVKRVGELFEKGGSWAAAGIANIKAAREGIFTDVGRYMRDEGGEDEKVMKKAGLEIYEYRAPLTGAAESEALSAALAALPMPIHSPQPQQPTSA